MPHECRTCEALSIGSPGSHSLTEANAHEDLHRSHAQTLDPRSHPPKESLEINHHERVDESGRSEHPSEVDTRSHHEQRQTEVLDRLALNLCYFRSPLKTRVYLVRRRAMKVKFTNMQRQNFDDVDPETSQAIDLIVESVMQGMQQTIERKSREIEDEQLQANQE